MNLKFYIIILVSVFALTPCKATAPAGVLNYFPIFYHLTNKDGLTGNTILAITQDSRGFFWMGTPYGLNRYDGREVRQYKNEEGNSSSLSSSYITSLLAESNGGLWAGTTEGLNYYDPATDSFRRIYLNGYGEKFSTNNWVRCLFQDSQGRIWIGTSNGLFCKSDKRKMKFTRYLFEKNASDSNLITSLFEDHAHNLWIGTKNGLVRLSWNGTKKKVSNYATFRRNASNNLSGNDISAITEDSHGQLWVGTNSGGLNRFQQENERFLSVPSATWSISDLMVDRKGDLWIAGPHQLTIMNTSTGKTTVLGHDPKNPFSLGSEHTLCLFEDQSGSIWAGSYAGGVSVSHLTDVPFRTQKTCIRNTDAVNAVTGNESQGLLIGTEQGLCVSAPAAGITDEYTDAVTGVKATIISRDGTIWAGSSNSGLWQFSGGKTIRRFANIVNDSTSLNSNYVLCLLEDRKQRLWVGTRQGLDLLDKTTGRFLHFKEISPEGAIGLINTLFEDSKNNLWIGTRNGLGVLRSGTKVFEWFPTVSRQSISYGKGGIASMYEDSKGQLWIGTYRDGIKRYDAVKNRIVPYRAEGLPEDVTNLIEDNKGSLWLTSYSVLFKLEPVSKKVRSYNSYDGIPGYEISERASYKDQTGELFFGTNRGLLRFVPEQVTDNPNPPHVIFTSLNIFNRKLTNPDDSHGLLKRSIENTQILMLRHWENSFTLGFSVLNYIKSSKNKFAYKLEEVDTDWNYADSPFATYNRLPPGEYTLLAKGANNDGIWSASPARLVIKILPPWWKTWWAYAIYIFAFTAFLFLILRFFWMRASLRKEKEIHKEKLDFFTNVSHEMRSHLMLISAPIEKLLRSEKMTRTAHRQLTNIHNNSARMLVLMKELMDFRKTESGNMQLHVTRNELVSFLKNIFFTFSELAQSRGIKSSFLTDSEVIELWFDPEQFEKVVYNLLSNAFKFAPDNGYVEMSIKDQNEAVCIHITDNGKGIAPANLEKIFVSYFQVYETGLVNTGHGLGLALSKSIVELHKGDLTVNSTEKKMQWEGSTTFTIAMQKGNGHLTSEQISGEEEAATLPVENELPSDSVGLAEFRREEKGKPTLLLAENHLEFRALIEETLSESYRIISCDNGKDAYITALELIPDLIISDIIMPEMDGLKLCSRIKSHEATSHIPIILLTAHDSPAYHLKGLQQGADAYISKPFRLEILELKIRNLLSARKATQQKFSSQITLEPGNVIIVNNREEQFISDLLKFIEENIDNPQFSVHMLSKHMGMSEPVLYKKVRALLDMTVNDFIKTIRLKRAAKLLRAGLSPADVSAAVGYADQKYFSREFKKTFGVTPGKWPNIPDQGLSQA